MEVIYPDNMKSDEKIAMENFAIQYAKTLDVALVSNKGGKPYPGSIVTLDQKVPYEYSDGGPGVVSEPYTIEEAEVLFSPEDPT